jgi:hypothetical protein
MAPKLSTIGKLTIFLVIASLSFTVATLRASIARHSSHQERMPRRHQFGITEPSAYAQSPSSATTLAFSKRPLRWKSKHLYLPISNEARKKFLIHEEKLKRKLAENALLRTIWGNESSIPTEDCLVEVPECEFFSSIGAPVSFRKCCVEHKKMKQTLFYVLDRAEDAGVELFLDSGTLLSARRDGGDTLLPWETDIDLGVVGAGPRDLDPAFDPDKRPALDGTLQNLHFFERCVVRKGGIDRWRIGQCKDAHYVYYATSKEEAQRDTSRVEIWPFQLDPSGETLVHPTRPRLNVQKDLVLPLQRGENCQIWGRPCRCPRRAEIYLDLAYHSDWRRPRTIHWGEDNVDPWHT